MNVYVNVVYRCGPPMSPATIRFTAVWEIPRPWYMISGIGTSRALPMRNVRSQLRDLSQAPSVEAPRRLGASAAASMAPILIPPQVVLGEIRQRSASARP